MSRVSLHMKVTAELLRMADWDGLVREFYLGFRSREEFYEYVDDPDHAYFELSYKIQDFDGFLHDWKPGDVIRPNCNYLVVTATFDTS